MLGIIGDWHIPEFINDFKKDYSDLLPKTYKDPGDIYFNSRLGDLIKIITFALKGSTTEVKKTISILLKIESPYDILNQATANGKYIFKRADRLQKEYDTLLEKAKKTKIKDDILLFLYPLTKTSFTSIFSNEISYLFPDKFVIIGRETSGEVKISLRSQKYKVRDIFEKAMVNIEGHGGGHLHACGAHIKKKDFNLFISNIKRLMKDGS